MVVPTATASKSLLKSSISHKPQERFLAENPFHACLPVGLGAGRETVTAPAPTPRGDTERVPRPLPCWRDVDVGGNDLALLLEQTDGAGVLFVVVGRLPVFLHGQGARVLMRHLFARVTF